MDALVISHETGKPQEVDAVLALGTVTDDAVSLSKKTGQPENHFLNSTKEPPPAHPLDESQPAEAAHTPGKKRASK